MAPGLWKGNTEAFHFGSTLQKRNFLRMTAKATLFGKRTFSSWLIENVGSVPIKRRMDDPAGDNDNSVVMNGLMQVRIPIQNP